MCQVGSEEISRYLARHALVLRGIGITHFEKKDFQILSLHFSNLFSNIEPLLKNKKKKNIFIFKYEYIAVRVNRKHFYPFGIGRICIYSAPTGYMRNAHARRSQKSPSQKTQQIRHILISMRTTNILSTINTHIKTAHILALVPLSCFRVLPHPRTPTIDPPPVNFSS